MKEPLVPRRVIVPYILLTSLFFMWGLANNMTDTLLAAFKKIMSMSDFQTSWIQLAFYGSYFCLAFPAAVFIRKYSYKTGVLLGLGLFIAGALLFYPASQTMVYGHFLAALFVLAGGLSILETSANPYSIAMGPPKTGTRRLNLSQAFNPIGSITGVLLSQLFILSKLNQADEVTRQSMSAEALQTIQQQELAAVMGPYVGVALFLIGLWIAIAALKMPKASDTDQNFNLKATLSRLLKNKRYRLGVFTQFCYVGAQIGVWSYTIRYVMDEISLNEADAASYYLAALIGFTIARFIFTALMKFIVPTKLLAAAALLAMIATLIVIFGSGYAGVYALVSISAFMSLMFPTIYGIAVEGLGKDTKIGGSGLIMAILGGAVFTAIQGQISDLSGNVHYSFFVPLVCFLMVLIFGLKYRRQHQLTAKSG